MKTRAFVQMAFSLVLLATGWTPVGAAQSLQLRPASLIPNVDPGDHAIPCVTDWDGDGAKDLLVGYQTAGKIAFYRNLGSDAQPAFNGFVTLQAAGAEIVHPSSGCGAPAPWVCDFNGDGRRDLLVGTGADGKVYFYQNTNTDAAPILAAGVLVKAGGVTLSVGYRGTPYCADWDGDGLADLLVGDGDGFVNFFKNIGTTQAPVFAAGTRLQAEGQQVNFGQYRRSAVRVFDWDEDGLPDLVGSAGNNVAWCRNTGSRTNPVLQAQVRLAAPVSGGMLVPIDTGYRMRLELVDWNHDGVMDLLMGNSDGTVGVYEGYRFGFQSPAKVTGGQLVLQWQSAPFLYYEVLYGATPEAVTNVLTTGRLSDGKTTGWTNTMSGSQGFFRVRTSAGSP